MELENQNDQISAQERPRMLFVLCILSWISTGFATIVALINLFSGPLSLDKMKENKVNALNLIAEMKAQGFDVMVDMVEKSQYIAEIVNSNHLSYYLVTLLITGLGLIGVTFMFLGKKLGFHLYIIYTLLGISHVYFFVSPSQVPNMLTIWSMILGGIFVLLYSRNLSWLKK